MSILEGLRSGPSYFNLCLKTDINCTCLFLRANQRRRRIPSLVNSSLGSFWCHLLAAFPLQQCMSTAGEGNMETNMRSNMEVGQNLHSNHLRLTFHHKFFPVEINKIKIEIKNLLNVSAAWNLNMILHYFSCYKI